MAVEKKKRLADYGLHSERVMWVGKGPGVFEQEVGDLEEALMEGIVRLHEKVTAGVPPAYEIRGVAS